MTEMPCWVITCPRPATMKVHVSSVRFEGERYQLVAVCDHHGRHVEGRGLPLAIAAADPETEPESVPAPKAKPAPVKRVSRR